MIKREIHLFFIILFLLLNTQIILGNELEDIRILIDREQHATAHHRLWRLNHLDQATDTTICMMVQNAFEGNIYHTSFERFFMVDKTIYVESKSPELIENQDDTLIVSFEKPEQWIKRALELNPKNGLAYYLLGFYYQQARLPEVTMDNPVAEDVDDLEKEIAVLYEKAFKYGYRHRVLFRYLGEYYTRHRINHRAMRFYRWNAMEQYFDSESVLQLATLYLNDKKPKQALELAFSALSHLFDADFNLKYMALRIIANANREQKQQDKFLYYIQLCLQLIPEQPEAYLDMVEFYDSQGKIDSMMLWMERLFEQNPYDPKNYRMLEYISRHYLVYNELIDLLERVRETYANYDAVMAYAWWAQGDINFHFGKNNAAREAWEKSKSSFLKFTKPKDPVFKQIGKLKR